MTRPGWWVLVATAVAVALFVEWHTDEVTIVLAVMSLMAFGLGAWQPQRSLIGGALLGFSIITAHAVTEGLGVMRPSYMHAAAAIGDWIAMAVAGLWTIAVAWLGGWARARAEISHAA